MWKHLVKFKTHNFQSIECVPWSIEIMKKILKKICMTWSILNSCWIDREGKFNRSKGILTKSWVDLIDSRFLFDRLKMNIWSIEGNSQSVKTRETEFSRISTKQFSKVFMNKLPSYEHNRLSLRLKTEYHWCYSLKFQFNLLNIKLKQRHNINIIFL